MTNETKCGDCKGDICLTSDLCDEHFVAMWEHRRDAQPRLVCGNFDGAHEKVQWTECPCSDVYRGRYDRLTSASKKAQP